MTSVCLLIISLQSVKAGVLERSPNKEKRIKKIWILVLVEPMLK